MNYHRPGQFQMLPPAVKNLLIINGLFFLATISLERIGINLTNMFGLHYFESEYFEPYQFVTYMFMHGGYSHIFFNMFALWMFGNSLENLWGSKRFLTFYFVTGIGAALLQTAVNFWTITELKTAIAAYHAMPTPENFLALINEYLPGFPVNTGFIREWQLDPTNTAYINETYKFINDALQLKINIPTVGASGAIFGLLLAFGMMFPNAIIYIYFAIPMKAKYFVILYGLLELFGGVMNQPGDNVAHFAHLGGMVFGYFMIRYWKKNQFKIY